ncbi:hypothetical protein ACJX0J_034644, partial [Zea mays]
IFYKNMIITNKIFLENIIVIVPLHFFHHKYTLLNIIVSWYLLVLGLFQHIVNAKIELMYSFKTFTIYMSILVINIAIKSITHRFYLETTSLFLSNSPQKEQPR